MKDFNIKVGQAFSFYQIIGKEDKNSIEIFNKPKETENVINKNKGREKINNAIKSEDLIAMDRKPKKRNNVEEYVEESDEDQSDRQNDDDKENNEESNDENNNEDEEEKGEIEFKNINQIFKINIFFNNEIIDTGFIRISLFI